MNIQSYLNRPVAAFFYTVMSLSISTIAIADDQLDRQAAKKAEDVPAAVLMKIDGDKSSVSFLEVKKIDKSVADEFNSKDELTQEKVDELLGKVADSVSPSENTIAVSSERTTRRFKRDLDKYSSTQAFGMKYRSTGWYGPTGVVLPSQYSVQTQFYYPQATVAYGSYRTYQTYQTAQFYYAPSFYVQQPYQYSYGVNAGPVCCGQYTQTTYTYGFGGYVGGSQYVLYYPNRF